MPTKGIIGTFNAGQYPNKSKLPFTYLMLSVDHNKAKSGKSIPAWPVKTDPELNVYGVLPIPKEIMVGTEVTSVACCPFILYFYVIISVCYIHY